VFRKTSIHQYVVDSIRDFRTKANISQIELGNILCVGRTFIANVENPFHPAVYNLNKINELALHFKVPLSTFLPDTGIEPGMMMDKSELKDILNKIKDRKEKIRLSRKGEDLSEKERQSKMMLGEYRATGCDFLVHSAEPKILILSHNPYFMNGLNKLYSENGFTVAGTTKSIEKAKLLFEQTSPDIIQIDYFMYRKGKRFEEITEYFVSKNNSIKIIATLPKYLPKLIPKLMERGVKGCAWKSRDRAIDALIRLNRVYKGEWAFELHYKTDSFPEVFKRKLLRNGGKSGFSYTAFKKKIIPSNRETLQK